MENNYDEKIYLNALVRICGFKPRLARALIEEMGSAKKLFSLSQQELDEALGPFSWLKSRLNREELDYSLAELEKVHTLGCGFLGISDNAYPSQLADCPDSPCGLYVKSISSPEEVFTPERRMVSIVGTRDMSPYGEECCKKLVRAIASTGSPVTIVSGLALGVDICAHLEALECGIPTIAVMATGIDRVYPSRHLRYAERISRTPSCALVTDFPTGTAPLAVHFLRRNRIIAGMSSSTILIESRTRGGGMLTADLAYSYNRDVYAVPGRIDNARSGGCNRLIAGKRAEAIESFEGVVRSMGLGRAKASEKRIPDVSELYGETATCDDLEKIRCILDGIRANRGITAEQLCRMTGLPFSDVSSWLILLESDMLISRDPLGRCMLNGI